MEDKNKKPVDKKQLKKPTGKSATGKPLDGIEIRPQLKDTDNGQQNEEVVDLTASLEEKALTIAQRQKRARILRAKQSKIQRARELAKRKIAPKQRLEARAMKKAREIVKKRLASRRGTPYAELSVAEKIQVDKKAETKVKLIQKIAKRILPKVRRAEYERLASFHKGEKLKDLSTPKMNEEFTSLVESLDNKSTLQLVDIINESISELNKNNDPMSYTLKRLLNAVIPEDATTATLLKKSEKTGIPFSTLREVFERGVFSWDEETSNVTQEQFAFGRVNSYIAGGKAWKLDADLREEKQEYDVLNSAFNELAERNGLWANIHAKRQRIKAGSGERMRKPGEKGAPTPEGLRSASEAVEQDKMGNKVAPADRHGKVQYVGVRPEKHGETGTQERQEVQYVKRHAMHTKREKDADPQQIRIAQDQIKKKVIDDEFKHALARIEEGEMKPYVKPHIEKGSTKQTAWVASNKWGKKKYFGMDFKSAAEKHAKINEDSPAEREVGTDSLTKKYKKETPGQDASDLNESFQMAFTSGIGVTLSADDCGIKIKPGFEHHPDVLKKMEEMEEEVRSADVEGAIVRTASGKTVVRRQKRRKKIIGSGNLTDGKPSDDDV